MNCVSEIYPAGGHDGPQETSVDRLITDLIAGGPDAFCITESVSQLSAIIDFETSASW